MMYKAVSARFETAAVAAREIAGAEIATEGLQSHPGQAVAERDANEPAEQPDQGASASSQRISVVRSRPRARRKANSLRRLTTDRACAENTRKAPVSRAMAASMARLTR